MKFTTQNRITRLFIAALMSIAMLSCGLHRENTYYPRKTRTPGAVWHSGNNHNRDWANTAPNDDGYYDDRGYDLATDEEWKKLDIKLGRNDNRLLYKEVKSWLGTPYSGGKRKKREGTDCSGFVMEVYKAVYDIGLYRSCGDIFYKNCEPISKNSLREGDLVFFAINDNGRISHVGIYLKNNKFAHASSSRGVVVSDLTADYWTRYFFAAGRVIK